MGWMDRLGGMYGKDGWMGWITDKQMGVQAGWDAWDIQMEGWDEQIELVGQVGVWMDLMGVKTGRQTEKINRTRKNHINILRRVPYHSYMPDLSHSVMYYTAYFCQVSHCDFWTAFSQSLSESFPNQKKNWTVLGVEDVL